jgi:hypothetical protein
MGRGTVEAGQSRGKRPVKPFHLTFQADEKINRKKYFGTSEKCEILHGDRFEYFSQLLYWAL